MPDADLRAEVAALRSSLAALQREVTRSRPEQSRARRAIGLRLPRRRWLAGVLVAVLLAALPAALLANDRFSDVPSSSPHHNDINLIADAGITLGCTSPTTYCPNDAVSRAQMASFIARAAGLGANPPVANAKTLAGYAPGDLAYVASGANTNAVTISSNFAESTFTTAASVTIAAPKAGFVLVSGATFGFSSNSACDGTNGEACSIIARLHATEPGGTASPYLTSVVTGASRAQSLSPVYVFPVVAGQRTFALEVSTDEGYQGFVGVFNSTITALFLPFGTGTVSTTGTDTPSPTDNPRSIPGGQR